MPKEMNECTDVSPRGTGMMVRAIKGDNGDPFGSVLIGIRRASGYGWVTDSTATTYRWMPVEEAERIATRIIEACAIARDHASLLRNK